MFIKYNLFGIIYAILSFDCDGTLIPVFKCMQIGWEICNIQKIDITPAERVMEDRSCFVDRGSDVTVSFNFSPRFETHHLKWGIWAETVIGDFPLQGLETDARNFSNCPTLENQMNHFETVVHIPENTRAKLYVIRVTITGDDEKDVCCFLCEIRVRKPQITSTLGFDSTNPFDIFRQKFALPSLWDLHGLLKGFKNEANIINSLMYNRPKKPSLYTRIKNVFKWLFGMKIEATETKELPFLSNITSFLDSLFPRKNDVQQGSSEDKDNDTVEDDIKTVVDKEVTFDEMITSTTTNVVEEEDNEKSTESEPDAVTESNSGYDEVDNENTPITEESSASVTQTENVSPKVAKGKNSLSGKSAAKIAPKKIAAAATKKAIKVMAKRTTPE